MIGLVALGSLAGLDRTAFGQTMLAEPLVASVLAGLLVGDPATGLAIAVPTYAAYNFLLGRIDAIVLDMERASGEILTFLSSRRRGPNEGEG